VIDDAFAMGPPQGTEGGGGSMGFLISLAPFILMFLIMYFLLIRPQQKRQREHQEMLNALKNGDKVVTQGGIIGTVAGLKTDVVTLRIADNVKVEVQRSAIARVLSKEDAKE
jgi:preprotein translocase subunit YajC